MKRAGETKRIIAARQDNAATVVSLFFVLTLAGAVSTLQSYFILSVEKQYLSNLFGTFISEMTYFWYFLVVAYIILRLSKKFSLNGPAFARRVAVHLAVLTASFFVHQTLYIVVNKAVWGEGFNGSFLYLMFNNPSVWIDIMVYSIFLVSIFLIEYKRMNEENELRCANLEAQLIRSKLNLLRTKIHPVFLFSTLGMITDFVRNGKNRDANTILSKLSDFLRVTVYESGTEFVVLHDELALLQRYLEIELMRVNDKFRVTYDIEKKSQQAYIPGFLIQPLVEDFINSREQDRYGFEISISAHHTGKTLELLLVKRNDIHSAAMKQGKKTVPSVDITAERLKQIYGAEHQFAFAENHAGEPSIAIRIPFQTHGSTENLANRKEKIFS